ncbi:hypothetical protein [Acinetobacter sp. P1(2025)]|uniref:hypothetical protein n=1 Tax=Acinetobacter sp. P1(2025) TaxID=3446120 RepID=UPI003F53E2D8
MESLVNDLKEVENKMNHFFDPNNTQGFVRQFAAWVQKEWSSNFFYDTEITEVDGNRFAVSVKTDKSLADACLTYADFLNANTGNSNATYQSGSGFVCETYDNKLADFFGEVSANKIRELLELYQLEVPERYKDDCDSVAEMIFMECVDYLKDSELYDVCDSFVCDFSSLGSKAELYLENSMFKDYSIQDFEKILAVGA